VEALDEVEDDLRCGHGNSPGDLVVGTIIVHGGFGWRVLVGWFWS